VGLFIVGQAFRSYKCYTSLSYYQVPWFTDTSLRSYKCYTSLRSLPKAFIKQVIDTSHQHDVYVSTGDWAEHIIHKGPSGFKDYVEV